MKRWLVLLALLAFARVAAATPGPAIDWDPAFTWEFGATPYNSPPGGVFNMVGTISAFGPPLDFLNAGDPSKEYTFYVHGMVSQGTVAAGPPATTIYTTNYTGGTIEIYEDTSPDAVFAPNPPNAQVPSSFTDGTPILTGNFTSFVVQTNNFTAYMVGNIEGDISWTGGTLKNEMNGADGQPCPGLLTGGATWNPSVLIPGYIFRHDGKIDYQCPVPVHPSTWGSIKAMYR